MTTHSVAAIGRRVIERLEQERPDIRIKKIVGGRIGSVRLAKIHFDDGRFVQLPLSALGTHTYDLTDALAQAIKQMCPQQDRLAEQ